MSRDIFVQDIPADVASVADIPNDFRPRPIGSHAGIVEAIRQAVPSADFTDPEWGTIDGDGYSIEVNIAERDPMTSFAFHVRAANEKADVIVATILRALGLRAFDPSSDTGIFVVPPDLKHGGER